MKPIFTAFSPNAEKDDVLLALKLLFLPHHWAAGSAIKELEKTFQDFFSMPRAFGFESGRTCLYAILSCLDLQKDDEVLISGYTCVTVPCPVLWAGLRPVYVDIDATLNMSPRDLEKKITKKSKALVIQHTFGKPADIENLMSIAKQHGLFVIEDCAHALGGSYKGRKLGTFGDASFFSFGRHKIISSVFGGMVIAKDEAFAKKLEAFHAKCKYPSFLWIKQQLLHPLIFALSKPIYNFFSVGKIILVVAGKLNLVSKAVSSTEKQGGKPKFIGRKLPNALASLALHQFKKLSRFNSHRQKIARQYANAFPGKYDPSCVYLYYPLQSAYAKEIMEKARKEHIHLGDWHGAPIIPNGAAYDTISYRPQTCPEAGKISRSIVTLPTHIHITPKDAERIIAIVREIENLKTP